MAKATQEKGGFMADNKDLVKRYGGYSADENGSHIVFDSRNPKFPNKKKDLGTSESAKKTASILNQKNNKTEKMGVWRGVNPGYGSNTYAQEALQGLMELKGMKNGSDVIVYDTETVGTAPHMRKEKKHLGFYAPTEIGFQHAKMINGELVKQEGKSLSMLMKPSKEVYTKLESLIDGISNGQWLGMTDDVRRTLSDLTLYAGNPNELFDVISRGERRITSVKKQARDIHPLKGSVLSSAKNVALMKQGLKNLNTWGTTAEHAVLEMDSFMNGMQDARFAGYNTKNFDQPMMLDFLNSEVGKDVTSSKAKKSLERLQGAMSINQIDGLHALKTLYRDTRTRFGKNNTLETMKDVFGLGGVGQSHHALSDVLVTIGQLNSLLTDEDVSKVLMSGGKKGNAFGRFDSTEMKVGDKLFGVAGMSSKNAGEYDGVFRSVDNQLVPAYDMKANPIYRNATYEVTNFYKGVEIDGKNMFGVQLYNKEDELHHTIFRSSERELQSAIHGHLEYIGKKTKKHETARNIQSQDRARRRWAKMFSTENGGGVGLANRMYDALDVWREAGSPERIEGELKTRIHGLNDWNTDEFVRDFDTMKQRLAGEEDWIRGFINRIKDGPLKGNSGYQQRAQNMAFAEFGKRLDVEFGTNESKRPVGNGMKALELNINGQSSYLTLNDADSVRQSLYNKLYQGIKPDMGTIKKRYREMLMQLKSYNAMDAKKFEDFYEALDGMRPGESIDNVLAELSNTVLQAEERNSLNGALKNIRVEDPTVVRGGKNGRKGRMKDKNYFDSHFNRITSEVVSGVAPYQSFWDGKNLQIHSKSALEVISNHDDAVKDILARNGIGKDVAINTSKISSSRSALAQLAEAYSSNGMEVQFRFDGNRKGLQMVIADKEVANSIMDGSIKEIMKSNQAAVVDLPRLNSDGTLTLGGQNRVARLIAKKGRSGYEFNTGFDEILGTLAGNAKVARDMLNTAEIDGKKGAMNDVHDYLNKRAKKAMQNLSLNNRYGNPGDKEDIFQKRSLAANWIRGGTIDISDFAEDWYSDWYTKQNKERRDLLKLKTPEEVQRLARDQKELFVNSMGLNARRIFQRQSDEFIKMKTGLDLGMHSVKDTHVSNFLRSNLDTRQLLAFGYFNPMARENIMKTVNYSALDKKSVVKKLSQNFTKEEVERMTQRGVVSTMASKVLEEGQQAGDKISYLNMRVAYMNDKDLGEKIVGLKAEYERRSKDGNLSKSDRDKYGSYAKRLQNAESISTWDGMMIMSDEAARAYETSREKVMSLSAGAELTDEMKELLSRSASINGKTFDINETITFDKALGLDHVQYAGADITNGKVTISQIVKEDLKRDAQGKVMYDGLNPMTEKVSTKADKVFDKWYLHNTVVKEWNAEEQKLILEERVMSGSTTKFISDSGHRVTGNLLNREIIRDITGGDAQAILPTFESGKNMLGTELSKFVALAVDEAKAQIDNGKLTVGDMTKNEALGKINEIMQESFGINSELSFVKDGQIVIDDMVGTEGKRMSWKYSDINKFLTKVDEELNLGVSKTQTIFGNIGIGKQDVYDWENGIGLIDENREGLVKYGRKELDMISARASQVLGEKNAVTGWLKKHIESAAEAQTPGIRKIAKGLIRTVTEEDSYRPGSGDVVIRTTGPAFDIDDPMGRERGRIGANGEREISMHAIYDTPSKTAKDTKLVSDSYAKTIVDFGRVDGTFGDTMTFQDAIKRNGGTALLEMPDEEGFTKRYLRLVDFGDITKSGPGDTPLLKELQQTQQKIWRSIQEYQSLGREGTDPDPERAAKVRGRINELAENYQDQAARMVSNHRDGGLMKTFGAAKMDMAGRFRIQGVNPFENYENVGGKWQQKANASYKEGSVYMSRHRMAEMIKNSEGKIAQTLGIDIKGLSSNQITNKVLDNINEKGLYGFVNRYPTIKQSTIQSMRFMIDDTMEESDRGARLTVGTAHRLKADYDGDFLSGMLSHYGTKEASVIHKELQKLNDAEIVEASKEGAGVVADLAEELNNPAKQMNLTVGQLSRRINDARQIMEENRSQEDTKLIKMFDTAVKSRLSPKDALETREARLGKEFVGFIDNTRDKILNLATATTEVLQANGIDIDPTAYRNEIEKFTANFSQELISSKKFNIDNEIARLQKEDTSLTDIDAEQRAMETVNERYTRVIEMNEAIMNPTDANLNVFERNNKEVALYTDEKLPEMRSALKKIQDIAKWNGTADAFNNDSLSMSVSEGKAAKITRPFLNGQSDMVMGTDAVNNIISWSDDDVKSNLTSKVENWKRSVVHNYNQSQNASRFLDDSLGSKGFNPDDFVLSGATVADEASVKFRDVVGKFTPKSLGSGGMGAGAIAFGAMWAASAVIRSGPTPEGLKEQTQGPPPPPPKQSTQAPTARVTENNGEFVNIRVSAKNAKNMSEQDVAALVHQEIGAMTSMNMNTTLNVNDNTQNIDQQWLQGVVANAIDKGFGF